MHIAEVTVPDYGFRFDIKRGVMDKSDVIFDDFVIHRGACIPSSMIPLNQIFNYIGLSYAFLFELNITNYSCFDV